MLNSGILIALNGEDKMSKIDTLMAGIIVSLFIVFISAVFCGVIAALYLMIFDNFWDGLFILFLDIIGWIIISLITHYVEDL